jgi:(p)ppGpp synthase/HD superfamily hydrolase
MMKTQPLAVESTVYDPTRGAQVGVRRADASATSCAMLPTMDKQSRLRPRAHTVPEVAAARDFAERRHGSQKYNGEPYAIHLCEAAAALDRFGVEDDALSVAIWLHDIVEDTDTTLEEIERRFGPRVRDLVGAVTTEPGETRAARNSATYPKIRRVPGAVTLKLADRIANVERGGPIRAMYRKEHPAFRDALYQPGEADPMWTHLDGLIDGEHTE